MGKKKEKKQNGYFRHMAEAIRMELREHKSSFIVYPYPAIVDHSEFCAGDI